MVLGVQIPPNKTVSPSLFFLKNPRNCKTLAYLLHTPPSQFNFCLSTTMSSKGLKPQKSTKRKDTDSSAKFDSLKSKKPKLVSGEQQQHVKPKFGKPKSAGDKEQSTNLSKKERRVQAKVKHFWILNLYV